MLFEEGKTYSLEDPVGFSKSFDGNTIIAQDIIISGGSITVDKIYKGNVVKFRYADGGDSGYQSIMASEARFFKTIEENTVKEDLGLMNKVRNTSERMVRSWQ